MSTHSIPHYVGFLLGIVATFNSDASRCCKNVPRGEQVTCVFVLNSAFILCADIANMLTVALYLIEKETISMGKCCAYLRHQWNGRLDCEASQPPCEARWFKPRNNPKSRLAIPKLFLLHLANLKFLKTLRFQLSSCFWKNRPTSDNPLNFPAIQK